MAILKVCLTGGGSSGHIVPALAVAAELRRQGDSDIFFLGRPDRAEEELVRRAGIRFVPVPAAGLKRYWSVDNAVMPLTVVRGLLRAFRLMRTERPDVVFAKGSYVSVPVGLAAAIHRIPMVIHESDHSLGLANRILAPFASRILTSWPDTEMPPSARRRSTLSGLPIRDDLASGDAARFRRRLGVSPDRPLLLVFGGSSGSVRINTAVRRVLGDLLQRFHVAHICGRKNVCPELLATANYSQFEYLHDEMVDALAAADVVVCRTGATTLAELIALKKTAVLVPLSRTVSRGDQEINASRLSGAGRFAIVPDDASLVEGRTLLASCNELLARTTRAVAPTRPPEVEVRAATRAVVDEVKRAAELRRATRRR